MSEASTQSTQKTDEAAKEAKAKAPVEEKPFTTDVLQSCTSRFTRKAWNIYLNYQKDISKIRTVPVRATLEVRSPEVAEELHKTLQEQGVQELSRQGKTLSMTTTFETLQTVIKHQETKMLDVAEI